MVGFFCGKALEKELREWSRAGPGPVAAGAGLLLHTDPDAGPRRHTALLRMWQGGRGPPWGPKPL